MIARNVTKHDLEQALVAVNLQYRGNIKFKRLDPFGKGFRFTLTVKSSKGLGGRVSREGRRIAAACWHVRGHFFEELFKINEKAVVVSMGNRIDIDSGNWQDRNIGSMVYPFMYSEGCRCSSDN